MSAPSAENLAVDISDVTFEYPSNSEWSLALPRMSVAPGEHTYIFGPSGCGKTTLLQLLAGLLVPTSGRLSVHGEDLARGRRRDLRRTELMGFVFQSLNLIPYLNALDNVVLPCRFAPGRRTRATQDLASPQDEAKRLLSHLGLDASLWKRKPNALSVGQQQRVAVARALIGRPPLIICDEPTSALDPASRDRFVELLLSECSAAHSTAIVVSHDHAIRDQFNSKHDLARVHERTILRSAA